MNENELDEVQEVQPEEPMEQPMEAEAAEEQTPEVTEDTIEQEMPVEDIQADELQMGEAQIEETEVKKKKPMKTGAVVAITAVATVALCAIALFVCAKLFYNQYNASCEYLPTLKDYAEYNSMTVDKVKEEYRLPADMPDSTYWTVSSLYIPLSYIMESQGVDLATLISQYQLPEECSSKVTESTTIGEFNKLLEEYSSTTGGSGN